MDDNENDYLLSLKNITPYEGKWVAILDNHIVCTGNDLKETKAAFLKSNKTGSPLFDRIPKQEEVSTFIF